MLPFNNYPESSMIVRIAHEEIQPYNTRERAPYMFCVETINPDELETLKPDLKKDPDYEKGVYEEFLDSDFIVHKTVRKDSNSLIETDKEKKKKERDSTNANTDDLDSGNYDSSNMAIYEKLPGLNVQYMKSAYEIHSPSLHKNKSVAVNSTDNKSSFYLGSE